MSRNLGKKLVEKLDIQWVKNRGSIEVKKLIH